jgi:hypothetical protein
MVSDVIQHEKTFEATDAEAQTEIWTSPMPEQVFVDQMVKGICTDKKFLRRKEFLFRMWPKLQAVEKSAPNLDGPQMSTEATLEYYREAFQSVCRNYAKEVRRANAKKPRKRRLKKSLLGKS